MSSQAYPLMRDQLFAWALNGDGPADIVPKVCFVSAGYVYNAAHNELADLGANITVDGVAIENMSSAAGIVDADNPVVSGADMGAELDALVVYLEWATGTLLCAYIDSSIDASLPSTVSAPSFSIFWSPDGIFRI